VRHLNDGALRRLYDEPLALEEEVRAHYNDCSECQRRFTAIADDARQTAALLAVPGPTVDAEAALRQVKTRPVSAPHRLPRPAMPSFGWRKPAAGALLAAVLVGTLAFTPLAQTIQNAFEPSGVKAVPVSQGDLQGLEAFSGWGDVDQSGDTSLKEAATAQEAAQQSGLPELQLRSGLPVQFTGAPTSYGTVGELNGTVTFTDKAPSELHGTTMTVQAGPGQAVIYGDVQRAMAAGKQASSPQEAASAAGPMLAIIEMRSPKVTSTGKSVKEIKAVLSRQKGISENLKHAINTFDDADGSLPLPIPMDYATSETRQLNNGTDVTILGDNTKLGAGAIWVNTRTHLVYAVVGVGITRDEALAVANGLATA
jgi:hypothetical protein